ncbi:MAG: Na/Pi cotransporter family protein [Bacteroidales bacterium]|nr:Na/Pi cotransporter family protein [Bacteroidales bacterium]
MDYSFLDFLTLIGGVGLFLYGMKVMSEGLQKVAGDRMRNVLSAMTRNRFMGVLTGVVITVLMQSSSASTVMVVSFVNAGLMSLAQSVGVIMGANVGTTFTSWIIAVLGVKVDISAFVMPIVAISIPLMFSNSSRYKSLSEFMIGFALLFMGLGLINDNVPELSPEQLEFLAGYSSMGFLSVLLFVLVGTVITMIIQSSAATFALVMVMAIKGWVSFDMACAIVLGSNIGTTITPILASFGANITAKKAAMAHFLFNFFGSIWTVILYYPFCALIVWITALLGQGNPSLPMSEFANPEQYGIAVSFGLSIFHTVFNIINLCVMIWMPGMFVKICNTLIRSNNKDEEEFQLKFISRGLLHASELNIMQAQRETVVYAERVKRMIGMAQNLVHTKNGTEEFNRLYTRIEKYEEISDRMEIEIANYLNKVMDSRLSYEGKLRVSAILNIVSEIESVADSCFNVAKTLVRKEEAHAHFTENIYKNIDTMFKYVEEAMDNMIIVLKDVENVRDAEIMRSYNKEHEINNYRNLLRTENIESINQKEYNYQSGIFYMDIVCETEKVGDYIVNVVEAVEQISKGELEVKKDLE